MAIEEYEEYLYGITTREINEYIKSEKDADTVIKF